MIITERTPCRRWTRDQAGRGGGPVDQAAPQVRAERGHGVMSYAAMASSPAANTRYVMGSLSSSAAPVATEKSTSTSPCATSHVHTTPLRAYSVIPGSGVVDVREGRS